MKIIHRGTPLEDRIWRGVCHSCKSIVEAEERELKITYAQSQRDSDFARADCPVCKRKEAIVFYLKST